MKNHSKDRQWLCWLDLHLEETLLTVFLVLIAAVELMQVIIRKLPFVPALTWAEEFCRFMWIWSVFISLPYTVRNDSMLRVTALGDLLSEKGKRILELTTDLIVLAAMVFCAVSSVPVVAGIAKSGETSPAMLWPMWVVYSFVLIGFVLASVRSFQRLIGSAEKGGLLWRRRLY